MKSDFVFHRLKIFFIYFYLFRYKKILKMLNKNSIVETEYYTYSVESCLSIYIAG